MELSEAKLQDINASALKASIPELLAKDTKHYTVEYGVRADDLAVVFHFFAKLKEGEKKKLLWDPAYRMPARLEAAIDKNFDTSKVKAGYVEEMDSFYVIVAGLGAVPDPWPRVHAFLVDVEAPLPDAS